MLAQSIECPLRIGRFVEVAEGIQGNNRQGKSPAQIQDERIGFDQLDFAAYATIGDPGPSDREHGWGDIDADDVKSGFGERCEHATGPASDLENRPAGSPGE